MRFTSFIVAALLSLSFVFVTPMNSQALPLTVDLSSGGASFIGQPQLLAGGQDIITFTGLATGTYNFDFSLSSQNINITSVFVNQQQAQYFGGGVFRFFGLSSLDTSPFSVYINGDAPTTSLAKYSGEITVTAIPETSTWLMMLIGMAMMGFAGRYRFVN